MALIEPYLKDEDFTLYNGDVREVLKNLLSESVDCVVTSPPYWGLRDYGVEGQVGLEETPEEYVQMMVDVFREIRRVLTRHGTVWLNLGASYAGNRSYQVPQTKHQAHDYGESNAQKVPQGYKPKDLVPIPWLVGIALQQDGWYLRSDVIWWKPNPLPESVTDRPTKSHEYVLMLSKSQSYYFDQEAVREPAEWNRWGEQTNHKYGGTQTAAGWIQRKSKFELEMMKRKSYPPGHTGGNRDGEHVQGSSGGMPSSHPAGRNIRSVWEIPTQSYADAHFATFPTALPQKAILAGCPEQVCRSCGKPRERIVERGIDESRSPARQNINPPEVTKAGQGTNAVGSETWGHYLQSKTVGFTDCGHEDFRKGICLDPFMGSGTVALVARELGRHSVGIELSPDYCALIADRLKQLSLFA